MIQVADMVRLLSFCYAFTSFMGGACFHSCFIQWLTRGLVTTPKVQPRAFCGKWQGWKTPKRTFWCTASVYTEVMHCWRLSC